LISQDAQLEAVVVMQRASLLRVVVIMAGV
jgi:hypothetical protein